MNTYTIKKDNKKIKVREYKNGTTYHYDKNNNLIYHKSFEGFESWHEYDENDNKIYFKNSSGFEYFCINNKKVTKEEWLNHNTNFQYKYIYDVILTLKEWNEDITIENIKNNIHNIKINNIEEKFNIIKNVIFNY